MGNHTTCGRFFTVRRVERSFLVALLSGVLAAGCSVEEDSDGTAGEGSEAAANGGSGGGKGGTGGSTGKGGLGGKSGSDGSGGSSAGKSGSSGSANGGNSSGSGGSGTSGNENTGNAGSENGGSTGNAGSGSSGTAGTNSGTSTAAEAARKLGREPNFLIGMGNDLAEDHNEDGAYTLGVTLDLHYAYLVGLPGEGGWPDWNEGGYFVNILADSADEHGVTPMYDLYTMASRGEANLEPLIDEGFMTLYWETLLLLYERLADFDKPAVVHFEPDFWAFAQQESGGDPSNVPALVGTLVEECAGEPEDLAGLGRCMLSLGRMYAPKVLLGFHASRWAGEAEDTIAFLNGVGAGDSDFIGMDMLDRDAGCFEAHVDEACQRDDGPWYWDETNQTSPNFHEYIDWSAQIGEGLGVPPLWWQIPFGVPSDEPGGTAGHYRDNRVRYIFNHIDEFVDAGGLGAVFGVGAGNQTYITTDGGQFQDAVTAYFADPYPLP
jgi:hypothetical protein